jgi:hypothetical protein
MDEREQSSDLAMLFSHIQRRKKVYGREGLNQRFI